MKPWLYFFSEKHEDFQGLSEYRQNREILGGKGANLIEMCRLGLPVPPGLVITTDISRHYYRHNKSYPDQFSEQIFSSIKLIEAQMGMLFGDEEQPLLLSVRSGAPVSMPGMMDTVLNLGLNDQTVEGLARLSGDRSFALDCYRRFIQMYSNVVLNVDMEIFENIITSYKESHSLVQDQDLGDENWTFIINRFKKVVEHETSEPFPQDVQTQLLQAIGAVMDSWMNPRAISYRRLNGISEDIGTGIVVQAMVFGNQGDDCATGVAFTRNPSTGEKELIGEYLVNAQGEDVVAGVRTPQSLSTRYQNTMKEDLPPMEVLMPEVYHKLLAVSESLETHYRDMQDIEFTLNKGKLWILQTRSGKRTAQAAIKTAVDMVEEGLLSKEAAILAIDPKVLDQLLHPVLDPAEKTTVLTQGLAASPGSISGVIAFSAEDAVLMAEEGESVILVREETSPDDIEGIHAAAGILTSRGGMTCHAAVVARGMGRACVCGTKELEVNEDKKYLKIGRQTLKQGDAITIVGQTGEVLLGRYNTIRPEISGEFRTLMSWADEVRRMKIRANAETPEDISVALEFGAEGVGLCRSEHMFLEKSRLTSMRKLLLAHDESVREGALTELFDIQLNDYNDLFTSMQGLPITVRLLDPPLHEFLPHNDLEIENIAAVLGLSSRQVKERVHELKEANPMLGHRGCRVGVTHPEIYRVQVKALLAAMVNVQAEGTPVVLEIMVPFIASGCEIKFIRQLICEESDKVKAEKNLSELKFEIGTMIELPRAALVADEIAQHTSFFSFGTNDLTQTTLGLSRDDAASFYGAYRKSGVMGSDPFETLDRRGVGQLMQIALEKGRKKFPGIKTGICGEHGGDPRSIEFCEMLGLDYVSCSPYRVPIARLSAAQASIRLKHTGQEASSEEATPSLSRCG